MDPVTSKEKLSKAIDLIKIGKRKEGGQILVEIVRSEPTNETAWLWLSICVADKNKKIQCLKKVLELNPKNATALNAMDEFSKHYETTPTVDEIVGKSQSKTDQISIRNILFISIPLLVVFVTLVVFLVQRMKPAINESQLVTDPEISLSTKSTEVGLLPTLVQTISVFTQVPTTLSTMTPLPTIQFATEELIEGDSEDYIIFPTELLNSYYIDESHSGVLSNYSIASQVEDPNNRLRELEELGRISGYHVTYINENENPLIVYINTIEMNSISNADIYFNEGTASSDPLNNYLDIDIPKFGDDSVGRFRRDEDDYYVYEIHIRVKNFITILKVVGYGESILEDCLTYANIAEQRLLGKLPKPSDIDVIEENFVLEKNETKQIGPILNSISGESFTVEITVKNVQFTEVSRFDSPKPGKIFVLINLSIKNLGPGSAQSVSEFDFEFRDENGAVTRGDNKFFENCAFASATLSPGGSMNGCLGFEIPYSGKVDLIYAPYNLDPYGVGRYLEFSIRE